MNATIRLILAILILSIIEVVSGAFLKKYYQTKNKWFFISSIFLYFITFFILMILFRDNGFDKVNYFWTGVSVVVAIIVGYLFFEEAITPRRIIALVLIVIAIYLVRD